MVLENKFKLLNHELDFLFEYPENEEPIKELKMNFRRILFENDAFFLRESEEKIIGIYTKAENTGATLDLKDEGCVLNFGFGRMKVDEIEMMLSQFQLLESNLKIIEGDILVSLVYSFKEQNDQKTVDNHFLKEIVINLHSLFDDDFIRVAKVTKSNDVKLFRFQAVKKGCAAIDEALTFLNKEKFNAEHIALPSINTWFDELKKPELIINPDNKCIDYSKLRVSSKVVN